MIWQIFVLIFKEVKRYKMLEVGFAVDEVVGLETLSFLLEGWSLTISLSSDLSCTWKIFFLLPFVGALRRKFYSTIGETSAGSRRLSVPIWNAGFFHRIIQILSIFIPMNLIPIFAYFRSEHRILELNVFEIFKKYR